MRALLSEVIEDIVADALCDKIYKEEADLLQRVALYYIDGGSIEIDVEFDRVSGIWIFIEGFDSYEEKMLYVVCV